MITAPKTASAAPEKNWARGNIRRHARNQVNPIKPYPMKWQVLRMVNISQYH